MIVVDANLIGYLYLESPYSSLSEKVLMQDPEWSAPLLWRSELRNVLALYLRKRWLDLEATQSTMNEALALMEAREFEVDSGHVLDLAYQSTCSAYDCEFVALAQELKVPLVTFDRKILKDFPGISVFPAHFVDLRSDRGTSP